MISLILLPGTFLHELSHYIVGLLLNAKPTSFSIIPNKQKGSTGHVEFRNVKFYNAIPIALAPLFGGLFGLWFMYTYFYINFSNLEIYMQVLSVYLGITFFKTMLPSSQDISVAMSYPLGLILYGVLGYFILSHFGIIEPIDLNQFLGETKK